MNSKTLLYSVILSIGSASTGRAVAGVEYSATGSFNSQVLQPSPDLKAPFGGYKLSGNGREWGRIAFGDFLETTAVIRPDAA